MQNGRARPRGGEKAQGGLRLLPLNMGELANSLKGWGGVRNRALPCPTNAPGPSGALAQGGQAAEWTGNPKGGGARLRGGRGAPRIKAAP